MPKRYSHTFFSNDKYDCLIDPRGVVYVKDKEQQKYYLSSRDKIPVEETRSIYVGLADYYGFIHLLLGLCSLGFVLFRVDIYARVNASQALIITVIALLFLLVNIVAHELSHAVFIYAFGGRVSKIRFRWNYIFPALVVDTSDSYLFPRPRRAIVYGAGLATNFILSALLVYFIPSYAVCCIPTLWSALINMLPIGAIRSDGYNLLVNVFLRVDEKKGANNTIFRVSRVIFFVIVTVLLFVSILKLIV